MSLSTLLEAAKYLDYLDSNQQQGQQHQQQQHDHTNNLNFQQQKQFNQQLHITQPTLTQRSTRRQRSSKKDAANTMVAMSLPASTATMPHSVPIPLASGSITHGNHHASLSSSFTTESPLSSFASTALMRSKASEVTSASSSAASSLSSSDSSSSCGEILMEDNDFNQSNDPATGASTTKSTSQKHKSKSKNFTHQQMISNRNQGSDVQHLQSLANNQNTMVHKFSSGSHNERGQSFARYIAATSTGPQLVTMTTTASGGITSASAPIDSRIRAGHVIHAATQNACTGNSATLTGFEAHQFSFAGANGRDNQTAFGIANSLNSDDRLGGSSGACPPLMMARVQPMILNSISPSAHQGHLLAFQPAHATASSPTSSSSSYSRHRELHKTLEKNRRAHLRHCFELLKSELPSSECADKKTSHINIIKCAIRYVLALRQQECEIDNELQRLTKIKNELTERLSMVRNMNEQPPKNDQLQKPDQLSNIVAPHEVVSTPMKTSVSSSPPSDKSSPTSGAMKQEVGSVTQQPVAEQQLSFLLSQSKID